MQMLKDLIDLFLHLDHHLSQVIAEYGTGTYLILIAIIFCETGLVVAPFLPGDSLLFAAGAFGALGALDVRWLVGLLALAAIVGDTVNYWIGAFIGPKAFTSNRRLFKRAYLDRTHAFYERHGGKTIILARFVPIVRTFAPFVAGIGTMSYPRFIAYNVIGAVLWVGLFVLGGYFFGNLPMVRANFSLVILAIIVVSVVPMVIEGIKARPRRPA